jgi:hypothetical protein
MATTSSNTAIPKTANCRARRPSVRRNTRTARRHWQIAKNNAKKKSSITRRTPASIVEGTGGGPAFRVRCRQSVPSRFHLPTPSSRHLSPYGIGVLMPNSVCGGCDLLAQVFCVLSGAKFGIGRRPVLVLHGILCCHKTRRGTLDILPCRGDCGFDVPHPSVLFRRFTVFADSHAPNRNWWSLSGWRTWPSKLAPLARRHRRAHTRRFNLLELLPAFAFSDNSCYQM